VSKVPSVAKSLYTEEAVCPRAVKALLVSERYAKLSVIGRAKISEFSLVVAREVSIRLDKLDIPVWSEFVNDGTMVAKPSPATFKDSDIVVQR